MYDVIVKKFTFAISSADELLVYFALYDKAVRRLYQAICFKFSDCISGRNNTIDEFVWRPLMNRNVIVIDLTLLFTFRLARWRHAVALSLTCPLVDNI